MEAEQARQLTGALLWTSRPLTTRQVGQSIMSAVPIPRKKQGVFVALQIQHDPLPA